MQALIVTILINLAFAEVPSYEWNIDWSQVKPISESPGFWNNRLFKPKMISKSLLDRNNRIVGGWTVEPNSHPYQVALLMSTGGPSTFLCGGSIIKENIVLSAAHCQERTIRTLVIAGAHRLSVVEPTQQRVNVEQAQYRMHQAYNPRTLENDISILILLIPIEFNEYVQPIALPDFPEIIEKSLVGERATVSGWGRASDSTWTTSDVLRAAESYVITNEACAAVYGSMVVNSTLCMKNVGDATCHGDSGKLTFLLFDLNDH